MEFESVKRWLDDLVDSYQQKKELEKFNSQIELCPVEEYIHLYSGIEVLADVIGAELTEQEKSSDEYFRYWFSYRGIRFLQLSEERLGKYAGAA